MKVLWVVKLSNWLLNPYILTDQITIMLRVEGACNYYEPHVLNRQHQFFSAFKTSNIKQHLMYWNTQAVLHRVLSPTLFSDNTSSVSMSISNKNTHTPPLCRLCCRNIVKCLSNREKAASLDIGRASAWQKCISIFLWGLRVWWELAWNVNVWWKVHEEYMMKPKHFFVWFNDVFQTHLPFQPPNRGKTWFLPGCEANCIPPTKKA